MKYHEIFHISDLCITCAHIEESSIVFFGKLWYNNRIDIHLFKDGPLLRNAAPLPPAAS